MEILDNDKLDELEEKIENLVINYKAVKEEKEKLLIKVQALEVQNLELNEKAENTKNEKDKIINKIEHLMEKIDKAEV